MTNGNLGTFVNNNKPQVKEDEFINYENLRKLGEVDMGNLEEVAKQTNVNLEKIRLIHKNYEHYKQKFIGLQEGMSDKQIKVEDKSTGGKSEEEKQKEIEEVNKKIKELTEEKESKPRPKVDQPGTEIDSKYYYNKGYRQGQEDIIREIVGELNKKLQNVKNGS